MTPLAMDELNSAAGEAYQRMIKASAAGRVGTPDEIGATAAFLMGRDGSFIPPPSIKRSVPVMKEPSRPIRNAAVAPISSGVPTRPAAEVRAAGPGRVLG